MFKAAFAATRFFDFATNRRTSKMRSGAYAHSRKLHGLSSGVTDWTGTTDVDSVALDIHHIFPQDWCRKNNIPRRRWNSIINKTPISYKANRMIGGIAPSLYLEKIQRHKQVQLNDIGMNSLLESHLIDPAAMRSDNFDSFYEIRKGKLLLLIERAMGKPMLAAGIDNTQEDTEDELQEIA